MEASCKTGNGEQTANMKINEHVALLGSRLVLVPYEKHHVEIYHGWMLNEELLAKTASESLSLEEEYKMQQKWRNDVDKCTFIIMNKKKLLEEKKSEVDCMIGDVNFFLLDHASNQKEAEIEVMIGETSCLRKGYGRESVLIMIDYGIRVLGLEKISAKIGADNYASISLFESIGFSKVSEENVFNEIELLYDVPLERLNNLIKTDPMYTVIDYPL